MRSTRLKRFISNILQYFEPYDRWNFIDKLREKKEKKRIVPANEIIENAPPIILNWPEDINKPSVGLVISDKKTHEYWPKFERFLKANNIPYQELDIKRSNFIDECKKFDIIVWRTQSSYVDQWEAADKVDFIEEHLNKKILPPRKALWMYEDKVRVQWLLELNNLPIIKTFISYSKEETKQYINTCKYPFVSKDKTSSSSNGVKLIKNKRQAKALWRKIFFRGLKLNNSYVRQKGYVFFQEFVPNQGFDLRVIMVGNSYFGYYRYPKNKDYRASGSGIVVKKEIPLEVLKLAKRTKDCLPKSYLLAVDFLQDAKDNQYRIIETSIFVSVETCEQLVIDGVPGRYIYQDGDFIFEPGRFWIQELMLEELLKDWIEEKREEKKI